MMNDLPEGQTQSDQTPDGAASVLSAELGVTAPRRKMPPLCYVNMQTLDTAVGFWNSEIPDLYEAVYPEAYVDELLRERNNAELREFGLLGRANAWASCKALKDEITLLRKAARLIHDRRNMVSGSLEMAECDAVCKEVGLEVWTWPLTPNVK
jgi:hypothetical protein